MVRLRHQVIKGLTALLVVLVIDAGLVAPEAGAAPGDMLTSFDATETAGIPACPAGASEGLGFDGTMLFLSCGGSSVVERVRADAPHDNIGAVAIGGLPYGDLRALAWDTGRGRLWACDGDAAVVLVDPDRGVVDVSPPPVRVAAGCTGGLAYDRADDTLWVTPGFSGQRSMAIYHYEITGALIAAFPLDRLVGSCVSTGIALGGPKVYLSNDGCGQIYQMDKTFTSSTALASFTHLSGDLECDSVTFADVGVGAIWSHDISRRILYAWEIPAGQCEFGGGVEPSWPTAWALSGSAAEGDVGTTHLELQVALNRPSATPVSVRYQTKSGTARSALGDYDGVSLTVTFPPGSTFVGVRVGVRGDTKVEPDERFSVYLSDPSPGVLLGHSGGSGWIRNDD